MIALEDGQARKLQLTDNFNMFAYFLCLFIFHCGQSYTLAFNEALTSIKAETRLSFSLPSLVVLYIKFCNIRFDTNFFFCCFVCLCKSIAYDFILKVVYRYYFECLGFFFVSFKSGSALPNWKRVNIIVMLESQLKFVVTQCVWYRFSHCALNVSWLNAFATFEIGECQQTGFEYGRADCCTSSNHVCLDQLTNEKCRGHAKPTVVHVIIKLETRAEFLI